MPRRHIETRNIVFHIGAGSNGLLSMMKTEFPTNGERQVVQATENSRDIATPDYERNGSGRLDEAGDRLGKDKKQSLFRRPGVIVAAAALAIVGIAYGT